jgi:hypothetical protein
LNIKNFKKFKKNKKNKKIYFFLNFFDCVASHVAKLFAKLVAKLVAKQQEARSLLRTTLLRNVVRNRRRKAPTADQQEARSLLRTTLLRNVVRNRRRKAPTADRQEALCVVTVAKQQSRPFVSMIVERPEGAFDITARSADDCRGATSARGRDGTLCQSSRPEGPMIVSHPPPKGGCETSRREASMNFYFLLVS